MNTKILHLMSNKGHYGTQGVMLNFLEKFKESQDHENRLVCLCSSKKGEPEIFFEAQKRGIDVQLYYCKGKLDKDVIEKIATSVGKEKVDIIHTHGYKSNFYGLKASKIAQVPVVASLHGWSGDNFKVKLFDALDKGVIRKMDFAVCDSPRVRAQIIRSGMPREKLVFIPNGLDVGAFQKGFSHGSLRGELGLQGPIVVGTACSLLNLQSYQYLLKAFKEILEVYDETKLLIVCDGSLKADIGEDAKLLGLSEAVVLTGDRGNMTEIYNSMDIFVLPSAGENIPVSLLEAMCAGLAIVAVNTSGVAFALEGDCGKLVKRDDVRSLAEAISFFLEKKKLREAFGERARIRVQTNFSIERMVNEYKKVYESLRPVAV